jgi:hypothetical protein
MHEYERVSVLVGLPLCIGGCICQGLPPSLPPSLPLLPFLHWIKKANRLGVQSGVGKGIEKL